MQIFLQLLIMTIKQGCLYGVLALGVYITYSILDFPDLSVDGTLTLGGVISGILIFHGVSPWLALLAAFSAGVAAGCVTGLLHVKLHIQPLLCGILVMTALLSVNLMIIKAGTNNMNIVYFSQTHLTVAEVFPISLIPEYVGGFELRPLVVALAVALICKILLDWYLRTKSGMLLRAAGSNAQYVVQLARNPGMSKILGLALGNGFAALAGALITQDKGNAELQIGIGSVVTGLASVIIGVSLLRRLRFPRNTTKVLLGSIIYMTFSTIATLLQWSDQLKLIMSALFVAALVLSNMLDKKGGRIRG